MRRILGLASPRHRRWNRLLESLTLDVESLSKPIDPIGARDFIICGCPRTGTSLLAAALFQPPEIVVVMEPWDGLRLAPAQLFASLHEEIDRTGRIERGRLDVRALSESRRVQWMREGSYPVEVETAPDYLLGIKWPAFWRYLDLLPDAKFLVTVRHPAATIASFKHAGGRLVQGLNYDVAFNRRMNVTLQEETADRALRRVLLHDYINLRILPHLDRANVFVVRYERWFEDPEGLITDLGAFLGLELNRARVHIRKPGTLALLSDRERELIGTRCQSATGLGYEL